MANGEAKLSLRWTKMAVNANNPNWIVPVVIMSEEMLFFPVILGLGFFYSGLLIDVTTIHNIYWFKSNEQQRFPFNGIMV